MAENLQYKMGLAQLTCHFSLLTVTIKVRQRGENLFMSPMLGKQLHECMSSYKQIRLLSAFWALLWFSETQIHIYIQIRCMQVSTRWMIFVFMHSWFAWRKHVAYINDGYLKITKHSLWNLPGLPFLYNNVLSRQYKVARTMADESNFWIAAVKSWPFKARIIHYTMIYFSQNCLVEKWAFH